MRAKDMSALASFVHPDKGVRFSPYSYVDAGGVCLRPEEIRSALRDPPRDQVRSWGTYDGKGDPIRLTFADYYDRFVWDVDFTKAATRPESFAENCTDNALAFFGGEAIVVEYYVEPQTPRYEGMDWRALRIVLEPKDGVLYMVGIIHAEWTV